MREEQALELSLCRDEIHARIDGKVFGSQLDFDPDRVRRSLHEMRSDLTERGRSIDAKLDEFAERFKKGERLRRDLLVRVAKLEHMLRGLPAPPPPHIASWKLDPANYAAIPVMSDGTTGAKIELRGLFEAFYEETKS